MDGKKIRAAVIGAGGYAGIEACRVLLGHPGFELVAAASDSMEGSLLGEEYPALVGQSGLRFCKTDYEAIAEACDVVFLAVPHTAAMACAPTFLNRGKAVVDLSADFRIHDRAVYEKWYGVEHTAPELLARAVFGQPESHRDALVALHDAWDLADPATAPLVACAGCYPTATILASRPALAAGLVSQGRPVIVNALSGVSGAGKKANARTHFCHAHESCEAYSAGKHRHAPEISQELSEAAGFGVDVVFTPHLVPMRRGLLSTVALDLVEGVTAEQVADAYEKAYAGERFVHFLGTTMPQTASVTGGNHAHVGISVEEQTGTLIASCAIDNLCKGAASQAVQCANILCGFDEAAGLDSPVPAV